MKEKISLKILSGPVALLAAGLGLYTGYPTLKERTKHKLAVVKNKRKIISSDLKEKKIIYLTFDDGPSGLYTEELLTLLDKENVKATFFVVGEFAAENPHIIRRMQREGHVIGLHSNRHINAAFQGPKTTLADWQAADENLKQLGVDAKYCRPPWGQFNLWTEKFFKENKKEPVLWDVMVEDWRGNTTAEEIAEKLMRRTGPDSIVCLHDGRGRNSAPARTIEALRIAIPFWKEEGYRFATIDSRGRS